MSGDFVPLMKKASADSSPSFRIKVVPGAGEPAAPFLPCPRPEASASSPGGASALGGAAASQAHGQPQITLEREGDRIVGIRVQCPCGQVTELTCLY